MTATITDPQALDALRELADRYEAMAVELEAAGHPSSPDLILE